MGENSTVSPELHSLESITYSNPALLWMEVKNPSHDSYWSGILERK